MPARKKYILWFEEIRKDDVARVGGKGANLGEMVSFGVPVPPGFVVTASAYFDFLEANNLASEIKKILQEVEKDDLASYEKVSQKIKKIILRAKIPKEMALEIMKAYLKLSYPRECYVAVRSSATAEDLPGFSFAGQQVTFLNTKGENNVLKKVHECWASLFNGRAIFYRQQNHFDHLKVGIAVPVQKMIQSDSSGVMFTIDPVTSQKNRLLIEAVYGLGELIVQGAITPDRYAIDKNSLKIIAKDIAPQTVQLIKANGVTKQSEVPKSKREEQKISNRQIVELAKIGKKIHQHYFFPQDIEWAVENNKIYILQTRPVTAFKEETKNEEKEKAALFQKEPLIRGVGASPGIVSGIVQIMKSPKEIGKINKGDILVTTMTTPDFVPAMKKAAAIVTDRGGQTSHAAIVSRELGIPCVVGANNATKILKNGQLITVNGQDGQIYEGSLFVQGKKVSEYRDERSNFLLSTSKDGRALSTATKIYVNLAEPELAAEVAQKDVDGVGLLRAEFMLAEIGVHPKKLIKERKQKLFIKTLSDKLSIFCEHFAPRPVIYRATDFKTNEYVNLAGGKLYEPQESNPMLGYRGAFRYLADPEVFEMELAAIKKVMNKYKNLQLMIPFVHQPWELFEIKKIIAANGLSRSSTFKLYMMVEIPSNVILIEDFLKIGIDGVSIGSNDLTMLILGVDRDNSEVASVFDERDPAVLWALERVIKACHQYKVTSSICGQAPSVYHELVEKLVEWGITSISVNPDAIHSVRQVVAEAEQRLLKRRAVKNV